MNVVCAITAEDIREFAPDLLVLPEGTSVEQLATAAQRFPSAAIVTATHDGKHMRAHLVVGNENRVNYLKIRGDDRSTGGGRPPASLPVYGVGDFILGVVVCRDIEELDFVRSVLEQLRRSPKPKKFLCIPADMHGDWFASEIVRGYEGVHVALSNNNATYPVWRARSFVAAPDGVRIATQRAHEPICAAA